MPDIRPDYDAALCGRIPIQFINSIQPQGVLLVVDKNNFTIIQLSANAGELLGQPAQDLLGKPLQHIISPASFAQLNNDSDTFRFTTPLELEITGNERRHLALVHEKDGALQIEIELPSYYNEQEGDLGLMANMRRIMAAVNNAATIEDVARLAASEIKRISGFDKVMIYTFDEEWIGTVIAEEMEPGMDSYLGLRFPASDIPRQARELYLRNPYRLIPDRGYEPVDLVPEINPLTRKTTDLSDCKFRGVPPVHLQYLGNMNVTASMSTRIIHDERLWGLIACHHRSPKYLSFNQCSFFELLSNVISSRISSLVHRQSQQREEYLASHFNDIIANLNSFHDLASAFDEIRYQLLLVLNAGGVAYCDQDQVISAGIVPDENDIREITSWLKQEAVSQTTHYAALSYRFPAAGAWAEQASGLLVMPIQPYEGSFLLAFRPEVVRQVQWGGDPNKVVTFEPNTTNYHPRNSFAIWKETVRHTAERWEKEELVIAEKLRISLVEFTLRHLASEI